MKPRNPKYDSAYQMYLSGMSLEQVAVKLDISRQSVYDAFKVRGYQLRQKIKKPFKTILGKKFTIRRDGHWRCTSGNRITAHKFVWQSYHGDIPPGNCIVHIDRDPGNNRPENLECVPRSESGKYSIRNNRLTRGRKENPIISKFCLNCGGRIKGYNPSYIAARSFCSQRCLGEYRQGTPRGMDAQEIKQYKEKKTALLLLFPPSQLNQKLTKTKNK